MFSSEIIIKYSFAVGLPVFEVSDPLGFGEVDNALTLSLVLFVVSLVFEPVSSLDPHEGLIDVRVVVVGLWVLCSLSLEFSFQEVSLVSNLMLIPIKFAESVHFAFVPLSKIQLSIGIAIDSFPFSNWFVRVHVERNAAFGRVPRANILTFPVGIVVTLVGDDRILHSKHTAASESESVQIAILLFLVEVLSRVGDFGIDESCEIVGVMRLGFGR